MISAALRFAFLSSILCLLFGTAAHAQSPVTVNDADPSLTYSGSGWGYYSGRGIGDYQDDVHATNVNGDSVSYTFTGTGISYITETNTDEGNVQVYLDGALQATVNCYSATRAVQQTMYSALSLPAGSHTLKLVKQDGPNMLLDALQVTASSDLRIDAGSSAAYLDSSGSTWAADEYVSGGSPTSTSGTVSGTSDPALYQTQYTGTSFTYTLPVANGSRLLTLLFDDTQSTAAGQRVFNVTANGKALLTGFDIFAAGGGNTAVIKMFPVSVTDGQISLVFTGTTGQAALAALSVTSLSPTADIPAPGWAEDVLPTDDASDADGLGPAAASSVNLASGVEENSPGPDLWAFNPIGPSASYERRYRSARAQKGYASPGLSPGWTDGYDLVVTPTASGYTLTYDNGGQDYWTGTTGSLGTPGGAPYLVSASSSAITMTFKDRSKYVFTPIGAAGGNYPASAYLLTSIVNLVGHAITLNRDAANGYRVSSITNDASSPATLLSFAYNGDGTLQSVTDPVGDRQIVYGFSGGSLSTVSQIAATGTASPPIRWQYGYTSVMSASLLNSVSAPDPSNPGSLAAAVTAYDPLTGTVSQHQDAAGRVHSYGYMGGQTLVQVNNSDGSLAESWTQKQNTGAGMNADGGTTDAAGKADSVAYGGMSSPYLPTAATNRNSQTSKIAYNDNYGNVLSTTSPRGVITTFGYGNPADFALNQVASVTESTTAGDTKQPTSFTYYGPSDGVINGLLHTASSPQPDTLASSPDVPVTTTYAYDSLGNVTQTTGPNANGTMTVAYNYTQDGAFTQAEALGEPLVVTVSGPDAYGATTTTTTHYRYDARGNRTAAIDALGDETDFVYNLADQLTDTVYPATGDSGPGQAKTTTAYQYPGGPASGTTVYDESGASFRQVSNVYDAEGELLSVSGDTYPISYVYDGRGRVSSVTYYGQSIMSAFTTHYDYDAVGNLAAIRYPGQTGANFDEMQYGYDADNNLIKEIDGLGLEKDYLRADPESLMTGIHYVYPSGYTGTKIGDVAYTYDHYGRRSSVTTQVYGTPTAYITSKAYTYDDLDDLLSLTTDFGYDATTDQQPLAGQQLTFQHNPDGSRSTLGTANDYQAYYYDGVGRLAFTYLPYTAFGENYSYLANGWLSRKQAFGVVSNRIQPYLQVDKTYNSRGLLTTLTNSLLTNTTLGIQGRPLSSFAGQSPARMTYDPDGNRLQEMATVPAFGNAPDSSRLIQYQYDRLDELTREATTSSAAALNYTNTFAYDLSGNTTSSSRLSGSGVNADNQYTQTPGSGGASVTVPFNGNGDPLKLSYFGIAAYPAVYDPEDRLTTADDDAIPSYTYDADGLRSWNYYGFTGGNSYSLFDGSQSVFESDNQGTEQSFTMYGADGLAGRQTASYGYFAETYDPQGSVVEAVNLGPANAPRVPTVSAFDAFGLSHAQTANNFRSGDAYDPVGFGGQFGYYHDYTGRYLLGHRYYDSYAGRFVTRDPIGYKGGINLYGFTGNNPVNMSDPSGFAPEGSEKAEGNPWQSEAMQEAAELAREKELRDEEAENEAKRSTLGQVFELQRRLESPSVARARANAIMKSIERQARNLERIERSQEPSRPQYNNPGHHEPGRPNYDPEKDILPKDASQVYKGAITLDGRMYYGKNAAGDIYRYSPESDAGIGSGYRHWSGSTGTPRGLPDTPNQIYKRLGVKRR